MLPKLDRPCKCPFSLGFSAPVFETLRFTLSLSLSIDALLFTFTGNSYYDSYLYAFPNASSARNRVE